jgi:hypothetical protein
MRNQGLLSELNRAEIQLCWQLGLILETDIIILSFVWWGNGVYFIYLLKLRGCRGRVARPIIAVHIKYVLQKLTVGAIWCNGVDFSLNESLKPMHCM